MPSLTDHFMHVLLADASWGADPSAPGRQPVRVNFFARDPAALPRPRRPAGDIIRLHRARVRMFTEREREREREREKERDGARASLSTPFLIHFAHVAHTFHSQVSTWGDSSARNLVARIGSGGTGGHAPSAFVLFDGAAGGGTDPYQVREEERERDKNMSAFFNPRL